MRVDVALHDLGAAARSRPFDFSRAAPAFLHAVPAAFAGITIAVDALLVIDSFTLSYTLRTVFPEGFTPAFIPDSPAWMVAIVAVLSVVLLASRGLYDLEHPLPWPSRLYAIVSSISIALVGAVVLSLFLGEPFARPWSAAGSAFAVAAVAIWHAGIGRGYATLHGTLVPARRAIVVGANPTGLKLARELEQKGYEVVGFADDTSELPVECDRPLLGPIARLDEFVRSSMADELVVALPAERWGQFDRVVTRGFARYVRVKYAPDFSDLLPRRVDVRWIGRHYLDFAPVARVSWMKRAVDLILAVTALIVLLPLFAALAIGVKLDSPGPTFYSQLRVGKDGRHFRMLKFRSMRQDAEKLMADLMAMNEVSGPMFKIRCDPRVTRLGRILRRYSLDELPQLINVVRGEMSLVGPRPPTVAEVEKYEDWQLGRLRARPGITGLWQVSGRTEIPFHDMVRLDLHYIRNWSLAMDAEILLRTVPAVVTTRGAY